MSLNMASTQGYKKGLQSVAIGSLKVTQVLASQQCGYWVIRHVSGFITPTEVKSAQNGSQIPLH